jgi:hypothetical protein
VIIWEMGREKEIGKRNTIYANAIFLKLVGITHDYFLLLNFLYLKSGSISKSRNLFFGYSHIATKWKCIWLYKHVNCNIVTAIIRVQPKRPSMGDQSHKLQFILTKEECSFTFNELNLYYQHGIVYRTYF